jgi:hypothetical protein
MKRLVIVMCAAAVVGLASAAAETNASVDLVPRSGLTDTVKLDTSMLASTNYDVQYITQGNLSSMVFPYLWPSTGIPVPYAIAQGAVLDVHDGGDITQVQRAANTWSTITNSRFSFVQTAFDGHWGLGDGSNEIGWIYDPSTWTALGLPSGAIGVTYSFASGSTYQEFDMLLNGVYDYWYADSSDPYYGQSSAMNVGHIALHELGHAAGLKDLYNPGQPGYESWMGTGNENATMYGYSAGHNEDVTLSSVDEGAMRLAYPETAAIPEPCTLAIWSLFGGIGAIVGYRRRKAALAA